MTVEATVSPRADVIPEGAAVQAFLKTEAEVERRENRVPIPAPAANGVIKEGKVTLKGLAALTDYVLEAVVDEVQTITVKATKGKFKIKYAGQETAAIKYNATAKEVEEALEALSNIGAGEVEVTGGPGDATGTKPYVVKFLLSASGTNVAAMTTVVTELEEGTKTATVATKTEGSKGGPSGIQRSYLFTTGAE
jgi:hypothetical protein